MGEVFSLEHGPGISSVSLLIVIALAFLIPLLLSRVKFIFIPIVVGEIIVGMIFGQSGLDWVHEDTVLSVLSKIGFVYLMFLSGLEIDFPTVLRAEEGAKGTGVRSLIRNPLIVGAVSFGLTLSGSAVASFFLHGAGLIKSPWIMALILSTTSLGVVVPVLKERRLTGGRYGQALLVAALVGDFATMLLTSVYVILRSSGPSPQVLLVLVLFAAFVVVYRVSRLLKKHLPAERIIQEVSSATSQIELRASFALAIVFIALAETLGIQNILGAFLAGAIVSLLSEGESSTVRHKLDAVGFGFFVPIFFIMVGVRFDLPALLASGSALVLVPLLLGIAYVVKLIPALLYRFSFSWRQTFGAGTLLSARLSLIIAVSAIGLQLGLISSALNSAIILVAVITCTLSPVLFARMVRANQVARDRVIIVGSRKSAGLLAGRLREHDLNTVLIRSASGGGRSAALNGVPEVGREPTVPATLRQADIRKARALIAMEESDEESLRICRMARRQYGVENVIAWVQDPSMNDSFRALGVRVVNPAYSAVLVMESMVLNPDAFSMTADVDEARGVRQVKVKNRKLANRHLNEIPLPEDVVVLMMERKGHMLSPDTLHHNRRVLQINDTVTLIGQEEQVREAARMFSRATDETVEPEETEALAR